MKADLHCHSRVSDGSMEIEDIVALAQRVGVGTLCIADHDTFAGLPEAQRAGREYGVDIIPGIEISAYDYGRQRKAHVLGYFMDYPGKVGQLCSPLIQQRQDKARCMVEKLIEAGYPLTWDFVDNIAMGSTNVYKQHIMHALMHLGLAESIHDSLYYRLFAHPGHDQAAGLAYVEMEYIEVHKAVRTVKEAGGIAVLAHPAGYRNMELVPELIDDGLDGLEVWHPSHTPRDMELIMEMTRRYNLIATGGSDFHGMYEGQANPLGNYYMSREMLQQLYMRKEM